MNWILHMEKLADTTAQVILKTPLVISLDIEFSSKPCLCTNIIRSTNNNDTRRKETGFSNGPF